MEEVYLNGDLDARVPHNLNVSFNYVEGESLLMGIKHWRCPPVRPAPRPAWSLPTCCALGRNDELAHSSIRFSIGRFTTEAEVDYHASPWSPTGKLRELPLWDMSAKASISKASSGLPTDSPRQSPRRTIMAYSEKVIEHYENPRNVGAFGKDDETGTGMVGARPAAT
jgi:hypothetical protein